MSTNLDLEVAHAVVFVQDPEAMIEFYGRVLGFEVTDRGPLRANGDAEIIFLSQTARHHHQLAFITGRPETGKSNNVHHVAFRSSGTLDDLKALNQELESDPGVTNIMPLTHGNAWSVYFADPEGNGVEVFIDTPWHVAQPQGKPLDLSLPNDEIVDFTIAAFSDEPEFGDLGQFYQRRADHLAARQAD